MANQDQQHGLIKGLMGVCKGLLGVVGSQQKQLESVNRILALHEKMLETLAGIQSAQASEDTTANSEQIAKSMADFAELERLYKLNGGEQPPTSPP